MKRYQKEWLNMLNNKGQSLVIFVICLPLFIFFSVYIFDTISLNYEKNKLIDISYIIEDQIKMKDDEVSLCALVKKNDKDIECIENDSEIMLKKRVKVLFGNVINKEYIDIEKTINK